MDRLQFACVAVEWDREAGEQIGLVCAIHDSQNEAEQACKNQTDEAEEEQEKWIRASSPLAEFDDEQPQWGAVA